jgi:hypothetical protein
MHGALRIQKALNVNPTFSLLLHPFDFLLLLKISSVVLIDPAHYLITLITT